MIPKIKTSSKFLFPLICLLVLYGCSTAGNYRGNATPAPHVEAESKPFKKPEIVEVVPTASLEVTETTVGKSSEKKSTVPVTQILLSGSAPAYREIADHLKRSLEEPSEVHTLTGVDLNDANLIKLIQTSPDSQVVAVGLRAARAARNLDNKRVVFCQVVNYSDHDLISKSMKGVSAMPSPQKLFEDWKTLSPQLERVLVVSGSGFDDFIAMARDAGAKIGITLIHRVVSNDREFLYAVKRNDSPVQGHWLLADNRIMSVRTLKEVMSFNSKEAIQTVVFQSELLDFGGLFYVMPSSLEISDKVITRLNTTNADIEIEGADILFLDDHVMGINPQVAEQLGLVIPDHMITRIYDQ